MISIDVMKNKVDLFAWEAANVYAGGMQTLTYVVPNESLGTNLIQITASSSGVFKFTLKEVNALNGLHKVLLTFMNSTSNPTIVMQVGHLFPVDTHIVVEVHNMSNHTCSSYVTLTNLTRDAYEEFSKAFTAQLEGKLDTV